jgi:hypothetical protein
MYRNFKGKLAENGIFAADKKEKAQIYNETHNEGFDKPYPAFMLDTNFPKTYPKSTLGIGLTEDELSTR